MSVNKRICAQRIVLNIKNKLCLFCQQRLLRKDKDLFKFCVKLLDVTNYFSWSKINKIILQRNVLWRFGKDPVRDLTSMSNKDNQKEDATLAYIDTPVINSGQPAVRTISCPREAWEKLHSMSVAVSEVTVVAKQTRQQSIQMEKGDDILEHFNKIMELINELDCTGDTV